MDTIEELKDDLLARWRSQFDRKSFLAQAADGRVRTVYATKPLFELRNYTHGALLPGGRVLKTPATGEDSWAYELDSDDRPVHVIGRIDDMGWEGIYSYSPNEAEYVEFYIQGNVPSRYERVALRDGQPLSYQRFWVQGNGAIANKLPPDRLADRILAGQHHYQIVIEGYDSEAGKVRSGWSWGQDSRGNGHLSKLEYSYGNDDELQRVVKHFDNGTTQTLFAARTKTSVQQLSATLSRKIADYVVSSLRQRASDSPLAAIEMNYRSVLNYIPSAIPATEADMERLAQPGFVLAIDPKEWIELRELDFSPEIAEFRDRLNRAERWDAGAKMLRQAARRVTDAVRGLPWATADFVAYAIDWEFEGHRLAQILKECGAQPRALKRWKDKGWI